jgi:hypothetical protein
VSANGYKLLGFAVWRGAKWYVRRRFHSRRIALAGSLGLIGAAGAAALIARRVAG